MALDALNWDLFQLQMCKKETVSEWEVHLLRHLQILVASSLECFLPDHITKLKYDHFYGGLPKWFKAMVAYLRTSANEKTYSDYLWVVWKAEKEGSDGTISQQDCGQYKQAQSNELLPSMEA